MSNLTPMSNDERKSAVANLAPDWWQKAASCQTIAKLIERHLLGLFIAYRIGTQHHEYVFSGCKLYYKDFLFWLTAGHVIDLVDKMRSGPEIDIRIMRWLDGCEIEGAHTIPVSNTEFRTLSTYADGDGIDFGIGHIDGHDARAILHNPNARYLTELAWKNVDRSRPEGFYLVGFPGEWGEHTEERISAKQAKHSFEAKVVCLPIRRIDYPDPHPNDEFWNDPEAFYGQILPYSDVPGHQPKDIDGMSGGPIYSIERDEDGRMQYWPFGIQRSWDRGKRSIRAEPIHRIISFIKRHL